MKSIIIRLVITAALLLGLVQVPASVQAQAAVTITPDAAAKSGEPGSTVTFNLSITAVDSGTYTVTTSNSPNWTVNATPNTPELTGGVPKSVQLEVVVPPNATGGETVSINVTASNGAASGSAVLSVKVVRSSAARPLVVIESYYLDKDTIRPNDSFLLFLAVKNTGGMDAHNLIFSFQGEDFLPQETGGVVALGSVGSGAGRDISQRLLANTALWGKTSGAVSVKLNYDSPSGEAFTESFTISLPVLGWSGTGATATPTPTGTSMPRAQLVVGTYQTNVDPLQPGSIFNLKLDVRNLGSGEAKGITMVLGGGSGNVSNPEGTPQPGGISGSGADLAVFAPLGSSNLQYLGDMIPGAQIQVEQQLIVNVSANPGAYALKLSFVYTDAKGSRMVDDQVITLLIYQLPQVEVNFYRDPGPLMSMSPNTLPIQVVNLGRKSTVLGNMTVSAEGADLMNNVSLVGALDAGGYFPLDVMLIPQVPGPVDVKIVISYTDDFNQARTIEQVIPIEVMEGAPPVDPNAVPGMDPSMGPGMGPGGEPQGMPVDMPVTDETFWQKALRFIKGLFGLDSGPAQQPGEMMPGEQVPPMEDPSMPGKPLG